MTKPTKQRKAAPPPAMPRKPCRNPLAQKGWQFPVVRVPEGAPIIPSSRIYKYLDKHGYL